MVGWHHPLNAHMFEQALGVGDGSEAWNAAVHGVAKRHDWATELNREEDLGAIKEVYEKYLYKSLKYIKALSPLK